MPRRQLSPQETLIDAIMTMPIDEAKTTLKTLDRVLAHLTPPAVDPADAARGTTDIAPKRKKKAKKKKTPTAATEPVETFGDTQEG